MTSGGQTSFSQTKAITLGADKEIDKVVGGARIKVMDRIGEVLQ